jgi:RNA polymerase sigma-70 factor (ECF subfamily)
LPAGTPAGTIRVVPMTINGSAGALLYMDGEIDHTPSMAVDGEKIAAIYIVRNPTSDAKTDILKRML